MMRSILKSFVSCRSKLLLRSNMPVLQQKICMSKTFEEKLGLPTRPKKPLSPFFRFMGQVHPIIKKKNPEAKPKDIVKIISQQWKKIDEATKAKLTEDYKAEIVIYTAEIVKYNEKLSGEQRELIKSAKEKRLQARHTKEYKKKVEELGKPKKPPSGYILFLKSKMEEKGSEKFMDFCKGVAKEWKTLPNDEKEHYLKEAREQFEVYDRELRAWNEKMIRLGNIDLVSKAHVEPRSSHSPRSSRSGPQSTDSSSIEVPAESQPSNKSQSSKTRSHSQIPSQNHDGTR